MKVLFYTYTLQKNSGGALHSNMILVNEFRKLGHEVAIVTHGKTKSDIDAGCEVFTLQTKLGDLGRPFELKSIIKKYAPDAVISNMKPQNINLSIAKLLIGSTNTKFIGVERNPDLQFRYGQGRVFFRKIMKKLYENLDCIVANSKATKEDLKKSFFVSDENIYVIYNTLDFKEVEQKADESISPEEESIFDKKVVINVGRLTGQKGQDLLLEAFSKLDMNQYNLLIIGEGNSLESLQEVCKILNIEKNVFFLGHKGNPFKYIKRADVFALTSHYEGFGRVVLESIALETPVVAFNSIGGHNELLENECGILVEYKNIKKFAAGMEEVTNNNELREKIVRNSYKSLDNYSLEKHIEQYIELILK